MYLYLAVRAFTACINAAATQPNRPHSADPESSRLPTPTTSCCVQTYEGRLRRIPPFSHSPSQNSARQRGNARDVPRVIQAAGPNNERRQYARLMDKSAATSRATPRRPAGYSLLEKVLFNSLRLLIPPTPSLWVRCPIFGQRYVPGTHLAL